MNNMKQTILGLFAALILMTASCSNDEKDEPCPNRLLRYMVSRAEVH